jgi:hypothetical protein
MITKRCFLASVAALPFWPLIANAGSDLLVQQNRLFLDVRVNGHPVQALLDSAAETSLIDTGFARTIGVVGGETVATRGSGGDTDAQLVDGVYIEALGLRLGPLTVALLDLSDVNALSCLAYF